MAKEDEILTRYFSDDERYADLINGISFGGRQVVRPEDLSERDTKTGYHKKTKEVEGKRNIKYRDLFRKASFGVNFVVIGVENQKQVHYLMPVRCMEYDVKEYQRQEVEKKKELEKARNDAEFLSGFPKDGKLNPCITIVLYYGEDWDGSTDLHGLLDFTNIPEELQAMVNNYKINLLNIKQLEQTNVFHTDLKQVFDIIRYAKDKDKIKKLIKEEPAYRHMSKDAYEVIATFTKSKELMEMEEKWEGEKIDMCKALQDWAAEEREEGREEGRMAILFCLVKDKLLTMEIAAERANVSMEKFEELYRDYLKQQVA